MLAASPAKLRAAVLYQSSRPRLRILRYAMLAYSGALVILFTSLTSALNETNAFVLAARQQPIALSDRPIVITLAINVVLIGLLGFLLISLARWTRLVIRNRALLQPVIHPSFWSRLTTIGVSVPAACWIAIVIWRCSSTWAYVVNSDADVAVAAASATIQSIVWELVALAMLVLFSGRLTAGQDGRATPVPMRRVQI